MSDVQTKSPAYLWFDTEFTSLDLEQAILLQVSMVVTDVNLKRLAGPGDDFNVYLRHPGDDALSPWVRENLEHVLQHCRGPEAVDPARVDELLCEYMERVLGPPAADIGERPVIAGNTVHADVYLGRRLLPAFLERCHYRILDVSSLKILWSDTFGGEPFDKDSPDQVRRFFDEATLPESGLAHDAYYDVQASIAELAYYRANLQRGSSSI